MGVCRHSSQKTTEVWEQESPGMLEEGRPLVFAVQGVRGQLDHPGRLGCHTGRPEHFTLSRGPSPDPKSSYPRVRSLMAQDLYRVAKVMKLVQVPGGPTDRVREVTIHLMNPRATLVQ